MEAATLEPPHAPLPGTRGMPLELRVTNGGRLLQVTWAGAAPATLAATLLRGCCRCAECQRARRRGQPVAAAAEVVLRAVAACGPGAVNLRFSDGHERGIFPFAYLATLASDPAATRSDPCCDEP